MTRAGERRGPSALSGRLADAVSTPYRWAVAGGGRALAGMGATPNVITAAALAIGVAASVLFVVTRGTLLFAGLTALGALLDAFDGEVARRRGMATRVGSYCDAMCDRVYEVAMVFAVATVSAQWALCFLLATGSLCVSYAKARSAHEVPTPNDAWPDLMERDRRMVAFVVVVAAWGFAPGAHVLGQDLLFWGLALLAVAVAATLVQRCRRAIATIREHERAMRLGAPGLSMREALR